MGDGSSKCIAEEFDISKRRSELSDEFKYFLNGVGRKIRVYKNGHSGFIEEGQFKDNELNGFGRKTYSYGDGYIGQFRNGKFHGYGKKMLNE